MTREGFAKIINFMTIRSEVLVLVHCHIIHIVKRLNFMKQARGQDGGWRGGGFQNLIVWIWWRVLIYSTSIAVVLRVTMLLSLTVVDFYLFLLWLFIYSMIGLLICKYESFLQEVSVESLILRWPLSPVGLVFLLLLNSLMLHLKLSAIFVRQLAM